MRGMHGHFGHGPMGRYRMPGRPIGMGFYPRPFIRPFRPLMGLLDLLGIGTLFHRRRYW